MKRVLCFGDSNTWGHDPTDCSRLQKRWPVVLKELLETVEVIEDGACGRSTQYDVPDMKDSNGLQVFQEKYLQEKEKPAFDLIILMLGTNDLLSRFACSPAQIAASLQRYIQQSRSFWQEDMPEFLLISPVFIRPSVLQHPVFKELYDEKSVENSKKSAAQISRLAKEERVYFLDASQKAAASDIDGIHMEPEGHCLLAEAVCQKIKEIFKEE